MLALRPALVIALAAALAPALAAASDCKLKFRVKMSGNTFTETLSPDQTRTLNRNGVIEALNDGSDDLLLTLENAGLTAPVVAMRQANGQTLLVPPALFTDQRLKSVLCRPHATLLDTGDALQRFRNPAQTVQQAAATAKQSAEQARDAALAVYDPPASGQVMQSMLEYLDMRRRKAEEPAPPPAGGVPAAPVDLAAKFPELHRAVIGPVTAQAFGTVSGSLRSGLQAHKQCVEWHGEQAGSRMAQLRSLA